MGEAVGMPEEIAAALARGATVLTGKQRAARSLGRAMDRRNRAEGLRTWAPAKIFTWDAWTAGLWHRLVLGGAKDWMLLNGTQERALWVEAIEGDEELQTLRGLGAVAGLAVEAWGAAARYRGLGRLRGSAVNSDTKTFLRWTAVFEEQCRKRGYLAQARLEGALRSVWREMPECVPAEREIVLVGFDRLLPAQVALLEALRDGGCIVREHAPAEMAASHVLMVAKDEAEEMQAAAEWAREVLQQRPDATIGILVPGLKDAPLMRLELERTLRVVLAPEVQAITRNERAVPYEFSTGMPLDRTAMSAAALTILDWAQKPIGLERLSALLLSPYFAGGGERSARAAFDAYDLRRRTILRPEMTLVGFTERVERSERRMDLGQMLTCLRRMQGVVRWSSAPTERRSYTDWVEAMREILAAAGWSGGVGVHSVEFQTSERWESLLDELATLDFKDGRVPYGNALDALRRMAESTTFAPESREAAVQVMGPEESAGLRFDAVWSLRAGDLSWPDRTAGSPLLAWPLRRELGMPGSDVTAELEQARRVTKRIAACGDQVIFSYAQQTADGRQRPSTALSGLALEEVGVVLKPRKTEPSVALEALEDVGRLPAFPDRPVSGGMSVLKAQAACAFHAFAEHRLFATGMETRTAGMNAREAGVAVHGMLERFWEKVETQAALRALNAEKREGLLREAIEEALLRAVGHASGVWEEAYVEAQRRRLLTLGEQWLALEAARTVAFRVEQREREEKNVRIGPLALTLRLDRMDATDAGTVLIDYKTGKASAAAWRTERPDEPQLPLYAVLAGGAALGAVGFGVVRPGREMTLTGYEAGTGLLTRPAAMETESLEEQVNVWRHVLVGLATAFTEGDARVSPKLYPGTCTYCAHRLICRLDGALLDGDDEMEEEHG